MSEFPDAPVWPDSPLPDRYHNEPPLEDRLVLAFDDAVRGHGLKEQVDEILASAARAPAIEDKTTAGKAGELVAKARAVKAAIDHEREILNRPVLSAQRALKAAADELLGPMGEAVDRLKSDLAAYLLGQEEPVVRGDYGSRAGLVDAWDFEILKFAKLPLDIRTHPDVVAAIEKVIRARVRGGARRIAGVRIFPAPKVSVR